MLLTRSRLCPGPKPGSSLHLHVLGTPPAFVLSQDQTLREELLNGPPKATRFTKSRQGRTPPSAVAGPGPVRWWDQAPASTRGDPMYTTDPGTQDGVSIWHRRSMAQRRAGRSTASNLDTHLDRGIGRRVRMLLSFQRPSRPLRKGFPSRGCAEAFRRSGQKSIATSLAWGRKLTHLGGAWPRSLPGER